MVAILNYDTGPELLLQKQFRPPVSTVTIELPSGLIDEGESAGECALRELKEETGYIATIPSSSPSSSLSKNDQASGLNSSNSTSALALTSAENFIMFNDPGFCNTNTQIITVHVDVDDARNKPENLKPELEENEFIESFSVPLRGLWKELARLEREKGYAIDARVGTLALGLEVARGWKVDV